MADDQTIGQETAGKTLTGIAARNKALREMAEPPPPKVVAPTTPPPKVVAPLPQVPPVVESKGPGQQSKPKVNIVESTLKHLKFMRDVALGKDTDQEYESCLLYQSLSKR